MALSKDTKATKELATAIHLPRDLVRGSVHVSRVVHTNDRGADHIIGKRPEDVRLRKEDGNDVRVAAVNGSSGRAKDAGTKCTQGTDAQAHHFERRLRQRDSCDTLLVLCAAWLSLSESLPCGGRLLSCPTLSCTLFFLSEGTLR